MSKIEELEKKLLDMRSYHMSIWNEYGSELCAGDMIKQEKEIEDEIKELQSLKEKKLTK